MKIFHHNKDMDGYTSGAILKTKYTDAEYIGWDYTDSPPNIQELINEDIILIDITFKLDFLQEIAKVSNSLTVIDHHLSFKRQVEELEKTENILFNYIYDANLSACELGWSYCYPDLKIPVAVKLIGEYDTWRSSDSDRWEEVIMPFHYYMYGIANKMEDIPSYIFEEILDLSYYIKIGKSIMNYQNTMNESSAVKNSFEKTAYGGFKCLCINYYPFNSNVLLSKWDTSKYDLSMGFSYNGNKWSVSLRSVGDFDVSKIAKERGGGGHKNAAGFEVDSFDKIWD